MQKGMSGGGKVGFCSDCEREEVLEEGGGLKRFFDENGNLSQNLPRQVLGELEEELGKMFQSWQKADLAPRDFKCFLEHAFHAIYYDYTVEQSLGKPKEAGIKAAGSGSGTEDRADPEIGGGPGRPESVPCLYCEEEMVLVPEEGFPFCEKCSSSQSSIELSAAKTHYVGEKIAAWHSGHEGVACDFCEEILLILEEGCGYRDLDEIMAWMSKNRNNCALETSFRDFVEEAIGNV